ncbi:MAG: hypothetical protein KU28_06560 [Sulfurovum sp. PC08-66]|jgi:hypothetical protein|nr:MAG: hypothetical protein KU28_06560 [Sulfurovum sp. PC08-66]
MFAYIENILNFGFLGLAFLMLYLAYSLIKKSAQTDSDIKSNESELIKKFMNIAIVFMILAGPLQWVTIWVKSDVEEKDKTVQLAVALVDDLEDTWGKVSIRKDGTSHIISTTALSKEFKDNEELLINLREVERSITKMQLQIQTLQNKLNSEAMRNTLEEG